MTAGVQGVELNPSQADLLLLHVPNEVLHGFKVPDFERTIGMPRTQFRVVARRLCDVAASGFVPVSWGDVRAFRNALQAVVIELGEAEFQTRTGCDLPYGERLRDTLDNLLIEHDTEAHGCRSVKQLRPLTTLVLGWALSPVSVYAQYAPPASSARVLQGLDFSAAQPIAPELTQLYGTCDASTARGGCATDPARNTVLLKFPDSVAGDGTITTAGPVFFDAKMAIDADGSTLSKLAQRPNQPETALQYPASGTSLDSERVPYIVMPLGGFRQATGVTLGDLAAVVKDGQVHFAIVGDLGPRTHLGEGSMALHAAFGHLNCQAHDAGGNCSQFVDVSLDPPVLYFVFPDSRKLLIDGLAPDNVNARIARLGQQLWSAFLIEQGPAARSTRRTTEGAN